MRRRSRCRRRRWCRRAGAASPGAAVRVGPAMGADLFRVGDRAGDAIMDRRARATASARTDRAGPGRGGLAGGQRMLGGGDEQPWPLARRHGWLDGNLGESRHAGSCRDPDRQIRAGKTRRRTGAAASRSVSPDQPRGSADGPERNRHKAGVAPSPPPRSRRSASPERRIVLPEHIFALDPAMFVRDRRAAVQGDAELQGPRRIGVRKRPGRRHQRQETAGGLVARQRRPASPIQRAGRGFDPAHVGCAARMRNALAVTASATTPASRRRRACHAATPKAAAVVAAAAASGMNMRGLGSIAST